MKSNKPDLVIIEWGDAWSEAGWGQGAADVEPVIVRSVGLVETYSKNGVVIVGRIAEDGTVGNRTFIPKGMIRKITKVKY